MKSLLRDLIERRLWPLAIVLVAAIVAVPFVLHGHRADTAIAPPPSGKSAPASTTHHASAPAHHRTTPTSKTRDPFAAADVSSAGGGGSSSSTTSTTATTAGSTSSPPVTSPSAGSGSSSSAGEASGSSTPGTTTPVTTTPVVTTPVTTPSGVPGTGAAKTKRWDLYSVDLRIGRAGHSVVHRNPALLTPLPDERAPQLMYMGVTRHGRAAGFALGAGVGVSPLHGERSIGATCVPSLTDCAEIVVPGGKSVRLSYTSATGTVRTLILRLVGITRHVTESDTVAKAALGRHSAIGLCDLKLGDPIGFYDPTRGTMEPVSTAACRHEKLSVPFPGTLGGGSGDRR